MTAAHWSHADWARSRWLRFGEVRTVAATKAWDVFSKRDGKPLGQIRWFGRWRQYAFFPHPGTAWNPECLADVADLVDGATQDHRTPRRRLRA